MKKIPENTDTFTYYNANPLDKKTGDCVIRALSLTPGYDWYKVYEELSELGHQLGCTQLDDDTWDAWLKAHKYTRYGMPRKSNNSLYRVGEFCKSNFISDDDIVIVSIAGHMTGIKNRKIQDTWDCSDSAVRRYYKLEKNGKA